MSNQKSKHEKELTVKCNWCKQEINKDALKCNHCSKNQSILESYLKQLSIILGSILIIFTFSAQFINSWEYWRIKWFGKHSIKIVTLSNLLTSTFKNTGDYELFISHVNFNIASPYQGFMLPINKSVKPNEFVTSDDPFPNEAWEVYSSPDDGIKQEIIDQGIADNCFRWIFIPKNDIRYKLINKIENQKSLDKKSELKSIRRNAMSTINYYSGNGQLHSFDFDAEAILATKDVSKCEKYQKLFK